MENGPGLKMYLLLKMVIFQLAMLVYWRVKESLLLDLVDGIPHGNPSIGWVNRPFLFGRMASLAILRVTGDLLKGWWKRDPFKGCLGGGFKCFIISPLFNWKISNFTEIFQMGGFNHQPVVNVTSKRDF